LKFIGSIYINADRCRTYRLERLFSALEPTHSLQVVTLEKCGILDLNEHKLNPDFIMDVRTIIKQWIKRGRSIDQLYFIACNERMRQLAYELEREKIVQNVIWDGTAKND
jgi:glutamine synthetase type III